MADNKQEVKKELVAFADFEFQGHQFKVGNKFVAPFNMKQDVTFDQFRKVEGKKAKPKGTTFTLETKKGSETDFSRVILPVE